MKIIIFKARLDIAFKHEGPPPPKSNLPLPPIRQHWENFVTKLSEDHQNKGHEVTIIEKVCKQISKRDIDSVDANLIYIPHTEKKTFGGDSRCRYYMQTVFPWLFTIDELGWGGGASFVNKGISNEFDYGLTFKEFQQRTWTKESKFEQPRNDIDLDKYGEYILAPLQLPHDETIKYHSHIEVKDFIEGLTDWAKESKTNIVFKGHPANPQSLYHFREYISSSKNCFWIENANIHDLMNRAKACYVINSGTGLEAMLHEIPVVRFGDAEYNSAVIQGDINDLTKTWEHVNMVHKPGMILKYAKFYSHFVNNICYDSRIK